MRRNVDANLSKLQDQCDNHLHMYHRNQSVTVHNNDFDSGYETYETRQSVVLGNLNTIVQETYPFSTNGNTNNHNTKMRECLMEKESNKKYPEHLIKKYWMKNSNCSLKDLDILTFLNLVKIISQSSRDENKDLSHLLISLESQRASEFTKLLEKFLLLKNQLSKVKGTLLLLKDLLRVNSIDQSIVDFDQIFKDIDKCMQSNDNIGDTTNADESNIDKPVININHPTGFKDMRKVLEGKYSFLGYIPIPPIHLHECGYAYVLPSDILKMSVCFGCDIEIVYAGTSYNNNDLDPRSVYRAPNMKKLIQEYDRSTNALVVLFGLWSDGCYCGTESKGKRNTAKMTTIHICHPKLSQHHVFPIAFGKSKDNDDLVKQIIMDDINHMIGTPVKCYVPFLKKSMDVFFRIGYVLQDRPEHADTTSFMSSGGTYSKMVSFSCPIEVSKNPSHLPNDPEEETSGNARCKLVKQLSSCDVCFNNRLDSFCNKDLYRSSSSNRRCAHCYDWDLSIVQYTPPSLFPISDISVNERYDNFLKSKEITFTTMEESVKVIFCKIFQKEWTKAKAAQYSRRECITNATFEKVYQRAKSMREEVDDNDDNVPAVPSELISPYWNENLLPLDHYLLGIMHYLFLNVGSHLMECVKDKLAEDNLWNTIHSKWNEILYDVRRLSISWCKGWTLGSKDCPGSMWVSENNLGFSILCKSLSSSIRSIRNGSSYEDCRLIEDTLMTYSLFSREKNFYHPSTDKNSISDI